MTKAWTDEVVRYLLNDHFCPRCAIRLASPEWCANCAADLSGDDAAGIRLASRDVVEALERRQSFIERIPTLRREPVAALAAPALVGPLPGSAGGAPAAGPDVRSSISVQSVLAVAGAALVAVAAIVFTFLNPDLTDFTTRSLIVGAVTVVFLGSAWLLARAGLRSSAEAVGALGMVFVVLDVRAFSTLAPPLSGWVFAGTGTVAASGVLVLLAWWARIRTWLWAGFTGLVVAPAFFGYAAGNPWITIVGHVLVGFVALAVHDAARQLGRRFASSLLADRVSATVLQLLVVVVVLVEAVLLRPNGSQVIAVSGVILTLAVLAAASTRHLLPRLWSLLAGALVAGAVGVLPLTVHGGDGQYAQLPAAASVALVALASLPGVGPVRRLPLLIGGWSIALVAAVPALLITLTRALAPLPSLPDPGSQQALVTMAAILGVAATALSSALLRPLAHRHPETASLARGALIVGLWLGMPALLALAGWSLLVPAARVGLGLVLALALGLAVSGIRRLAAARLSTRLPLIVGAHLLLLTAAVLAWTDSSLTVVGGAATVIVLAMLARMFPAVVRSVYVAVGYAYALVIFAAGLTLVHVETIAVLCLTATLGSLAALAVTLIRRLSSRSWHAVLIVTAVPFLVGVASVLTERSGWTALSTGVTFLLALTLLITRRPGMTCVLRAMAAALLVPSLAVVMVCLGAQLLVTSGSPVVLPVIAVIVAFALPSTGIVRAALERHGIPADQAAAARAWIEVATLITGALAVLLSLVREAAGQGTSVLVLLIIGIGAAVVARFAKRRYGWVLAFASWTGALWCVWALVGVDMAEPYILPPSLVAALIGTVLVARGRPGIGIPAVGLFAAGLATAVIPSLALFAAVGDGRDAAELWRGPALALASLVLLMLGALVRRLSAESRLAPLARLRVPLLALAIAAAAAGPVQAVRWGLHFDRAPGDPQLLMWLVLAISAGSGVLAVLAGRLLLGESRGGTPGLGGRWLYAPGAVFLAVGPITAVRPAPLPIFALFVLGLAFLGLMLVTVVRARTRTVTLPPVWFTFAVAWCVMAASWSTREILRVEGYSLPLGVALLAAGVIAMRQANGIVRPAFTSWPVGFPGSWRLLAPGIVVTLLPSILATGTDPQTWRAILVLGLALASILIGSLRRLGAPFVIGLIVLPIENIVVFAVQLGRSIGATPWWITLATAGAVLLVIAVTSERRSAGQKGMAARLRDLR